MNRRVLAVLAILILGVGIVGVAAGDAEGTPYKPVLIIEPNVQPAQPTIDENFTVDTTITNLDEGTYYVEETVLRENESIHSEVHGRNDVRYKLTGNETLHNKISAGIDQTGTKSLTLHVYIRTDTGDQLHVTHPVNVTLRNPHPDIGAKAGTRQPDGETSMNVTVANGLNESIRSLSLDLSAASANIKQNTHVKASLSAGGAWQIPVTASDVTAGTETVTARLSYTTADGEYRQVTRNLTTVVDELTTLQPELNIRTDRVGPSGETTLNVTVANALNQSIRTLTVELDAPNLQLGENREVQSQLNSGETATLSFPTGSVETGEKNVTVTMTYTTADGTQRELVRETTARLRPVRNPGNVSLTGIQVRPRGGRLTIRGSVSNGGTTDVTGVKLAVANGERVGPAQAESTYFVGNVSASDFTSFQVSAALRARTNQTVTIPVRVSYVVDGVRKQRVIGVDYRPRPQPTEQPPQQSGGGLPVGLIGGGVVVVGGGLLGIRRFRG